MAGFIARNIAETPTGHRFAGHVDIQDESSRPQPLRPDRVAASLAAAAIALSAVVAACGSDDKSSSTTAAPASTAGAAPTTAGAATTAGGGSTPASGDAPKLGIIYSADWKDGSWGEFAYDGANDLKAEGKVSEVSLQDNVQPGADAQNALRALADDGFNPIIAHSFNYGDDVKAVAKDYPDTIFVYAGGFGDVAGNVGDYAQPFYEPAYLEGILAAGTVEGKVAGAGGFDIPVCRAMKNAFLAGAQTIDSGDHRRLRRRRRLVRRAEGQGSGHRPGRRRRPPVHRLRPGPDVRSDRGGQRERRRVDGLRRRHVRASARRCWPRSPGTCKAVFEQMVDDVVAGKTAAQYYDVPMKDGGMDVVISPAWKDKISGRGDGRVQHAAGGDQGRLVRGPLRRQELSSLDMSEPRRCGRRVPSAPPACPSASAAWPPCTTSTSSCGPARSTPCSARTAPARPRWCASSPGWSSPTAGRWSCGTSRSAELDARARAGVGVALVQQHFTLVPTLTASENLVLARPTSALVPAGACRRSAARRARRALRPRRARRRAGRSAGRR